MRYFDQQLVANSRPHAAWWGEVSVVREHFHRTEEAHAGLMNELLGNAAAVLPRDAWLDLDGITRRVMRNDEGQVFMADLMPLAKAVHIGKLVHLSRVSSDAGTVQRSMSGQVANPLDKVAYDYRGAPVPIFSTAYGREWREWNTLQSENFDALSDDQEAHTAKLRRDMAQYVLDGDPKLTFQGYTASGIRTSTLSKAINLGTAGGGANIDLTSASTTSDAIDAFFTQTLGAMLDANLITGKVNLYVSPEIGRNLDRSYSGSSGFKGGTLMSYLLTNRRINKIAVTYELSGNQFFGFVPNAEYIRPLVGMAVNTTAITRLNPTDNYQFLVMGALGIEIRADFSGKSGVFYSTDIDS
ncbi:MAG TPA: major capsid protein [Caulobacter sp.]|nr:major capsid protein [Caulobacter sp.]